MKRCASCERPAAYMVGYSGGAFTGSATVVVYECHEHAWAKGIAALLGWLLSEA